MDDKYLTCKYRQVAGDTIVCGLAQFIIKTKENLCLTDNDKCKKCFVFNPTENKISPVVSNILIEASNKIIDAGGVDGCSVERANNLLDYIEIFRPCGCVRERKLMRESRELR